MEMMLEVLAFTPAPVDTRSVAEGGPTGMTYR